MVDEDDEQFARFWAHYPKRVSKKDARIAWAKLDPSPAVVDRMIAALTWQVQQPAWTKDNGQFIPYPASWIHAERWNDEAPMLTKPKPFGSAAEMVLRMFNGDDE